MIGAPIQRTGNGNASICSDMPACVIQHADYSQLCGCSGHSEDRRNGGAGRCSEGGLTPQILSIELVKGWNSEVTLHSTFFGSTQD